MTVGHLGASFALLLAWHVKLLAALVSHVCSLLYEKKSLQKSLPHRQVSACLATLYISCSISC